MTNPLSSQEKALESLFDEVRLLFHALAKVATEMNEDTETSAPMRAVLECLLKQGAQAVPAIARSRSVTRQHIQSIVNVLLRHDLVALRANPAHKSSPLVALTGKGEQRIREIKSREERFLSQWEIGVSEQELNEATTTLCAIRDHLRACDREVSA